MANESKEIGEFVRKCKVLLLDIEGTTTSISFVKDKLFPYAEENVKKFLENQWENEEVKEAVNALRKLAVEDTEKSVDGVVAIPGEDVSKDDQIEGVVNNVKWQMSSDRKAGPLKELQGLIWKQGYDNGDIKGHVFEDVSAALEQWRSVDDHKVYIYSSGSVQAQKLLFGQSLAGDLLKYIDGHFDTAVGAKQESGSYKSIVEKIGCNPDDILFLTDILKEAEAARSAGLHAALVSREGNAALPDEASQFPVIHSLAQLTVSNKRKTDPQEGDQPAKIPKTDTTDNVTEAAATNNVTETSVESEKMDVEEIIEKPKENGSEKEADNKAEVQETATIIEEVTDVKETTKSVCDVDPIITEVTEDENSKENEIEKMDTDVKEKEEIVEKDKTESKDTKISKPSENKNGESIDQKEVLEQSETPAANKKIVDNKSEVSSIAEETPSVVITEIEEIKNDNESPQEVTDVIEDMEPIVEEPVTNEDIEELQNVGDVLEKECDEILSKVQDVTNLDSIPVKPLLNPIVEESMETENTDSNDIVDRILDTELELEMKKSAEAVKPAEAAEVHTENTDTIKSVDSGTKTKDISKDADTENKDIVADPPKETINQNITEKEEPVNNGSSVPEATKEKSDKVESHNNESENKTPESKTESVPEEKVAIEVAEEGHLNGKASNGEAETKQNGDDEELKSRLSAENGKEIVNGSSNGDSNDVENGLSEKKLEEVTEIKVKTIATEEPTTELIEQPTEA